LCGKVKQYRATKVARVLGKEILEPWRPQRRVEAEDVARPRASPQLLGRGRR